MYFFASFNSTGWHCVIPVNNHHKVLIAQDSKIESANKRLKAAKASVDRADERMFKAHQHITINPDSEKLKISLERAAKAQETTEQAYAKAVEVSTNTIGMGSGRVMVLLPSRVAEHRYTPWILSTDTYIMTAGVHSCSVRFLLQARDSLCFDWHCFGRREQRKRCQWINTALSDCYTHDKTRNQAKLFSTSALSPPTSRFVNFERHIC